jgi:zinc transport system permease protein
MALSCALNILFAMTGLWISYVFNLTAGATIILIAGAGFFISLAIKKAAFK